MYNFRHLTNGKASPETVEGSTIYEAASCKTIYLDHLQPQFNFIMSSTIGFLVPRRIECIGIYVCLTNGIFQRCLHFQKKGPAYEGDISTLTSLHMTLLSSSHRGPSIRSDSRVKTSQKKVQLLEAISRPRDGLIWSGMIGESLGGELPLIATTEVWSKSSKPQRIISKGKHCSHCFSALVFDCHTFQWHPDVPLFQLPTWEITLQLLSKLSEH